MALRKLQSEIDRTLKLVTVGVELFESTFDKLPLATNATQKDKVENDLKTQIKKLQKFRDQIKAWLGSNEIKDKTTLLDARKLIELQMERFKALEKEMKMKAFSKEGLIAQSKLDPAEKAKRAMVEWVGTTCEELARQVEQTEAEQEALQSGKKKKATGDRLSELDELNERRNWHTGRLEVVQRMLENGTLQVEQVETIQEDVKYFLEANTEEDFDFDGGIYDELNLQDEEDFIQDFGQNDDLSNLDSSSVADTNDLPNLPPPGPKTPAKEEKEKKFTPVKVGHSPGEEQPPSPIMVKKQLSRKSTMESKSESTKTPVKAEPVPPVPSIPAVLKAAVLPPIRYAAAAAAAVASILPTVPAPSPAAPAEVTGSPVAKKLEIPEPTPPLLPEPVEAVSVSEPTPAPIPARMEPSPVPISVSPLPVETTAAPVPHTNGHAPPPPPGLSQPPPNLPPPTYQSPAQTAPPVNGSAYPLAVPHAESSRAGSAYSNTSPRPAQGVLGNLMQSFDHAKEISERRSTDLNGLNAALDTSYANAPHQLDAEPPRYYHPKNPVKTPSYYPQSKPPILEDRLAYQRMDLSTLMWIFYYQQGTYEQYIAASELRKLEWRFHKQYLTWFQRAHDPQAVTAEYEQGGYKYFDWENTWCQRKKSDFRFEYRWLAEY